jgi:aspartate racemase
VDHGFGARIGLLGTTGTLTSGIYNAALGSVGVTAVHPEPHVQAHIMEAIALVKAGDRGGRADDLLRLAATHLVHRGVSAVVLACTEVGLALDHQQLRVPALDPMSITAESIVAMKACYRPSSS